MEGPPFQMNQMPASTRAPPDAMPAQGPPNVRAFGITK